MNEKIFINDCDITDKVIDWKIDVKSMKIVLFYNSSRKEEFSWDESIIRPTTVFNDIKIKIKNRETHVHYAAVVGSKYCIVRYESDKNLFCYNLKNINFSVDNINDENNVIKSLLRYYKLVAEERLNLSVQMNDGEDSDSKINNVLYNNMRFLNCKDGCALSAYLNQTNNSYDDIKYIFPFGINQSQYNALDRAFKNQISIIDGPPGTGKTQTILNIVANIIVQGKTVVVASNNNSAVDNIYKKLEANNLGYIVAKLGNAKLRKQFFDSSHHINRNEDKIYISNSIDEIDEQAKSVYANLGYQLKLANVKQELFDCEKEFEKYEENLDVEVINVKKFTKHKKYVEFATELKKLNKKNIKILGKLKMFFKYGKYDLKIFESNDAFNVYIFNLNRQFYIQKLKELSVLKLEYENKIKDLKIVEEIRDLTHHSMNYLKSYIQNNFTDINIDSLKGIYESDFESFLRRYPVIGTGTQSVCSSVRGNELIDYLIIDEASQQEILSAIPALAKARNIIIVGDEKQLPFIPTETNHSINMEEYDTTKYSLLSSLKLLSEEKIPTTLLKEHYRCHPLIIQFCNKQFYNSELIIMTEQEDDAHNALRLAVHAKGNHAENEKNINQLEAATIEKLFKNQNVTVITPFVDQKNYINSSYKKEMIISNTVHKYQGQEFEHVAFSPVIDDKYKSRSMLDFVDNSNLINVAVSRAKNSFTLLIGDNKVYEKSHNILALKNYIKYYSDESNVHESLIVSPFYVLYKSYNEELEKYKTVKGSSKYHSERIAEHLILENVNVLGNQIEYAREVSLDKIVNVRNSIFTEREKSFMTHKSSCDFLIYNNVAKRNLGVIEIDGREHRKEYRKINDAMKNSILEKAGIPWLRIETTGKTYSSIDDERWKFGEHEQAIESFLKLIC